LDGDESETGEDDAADAPSLASADGEAAPKKRRRRRRKPSGAGGAEGGAPPADGAA